MKGNKKDKQLPNSGAKLASTVKGQTLGNQDMKKSSTQKKKSGKKKYLKAPFQHEWPEISAQVCGSVVTLLKNTFAAQGLRRELCTRGGKKTKEEKICGDASTEGDFNHNTTWNYLIFGVNAVTRSMEKGEASLLLCDKEVYPSQLTFHLLELSIHNEVPAASILGLSSIGEIVGLRSVTCLAFKLLSDIENESLSSMVSSVISMIPKLWSPILQQKAPVLDLSQVSDTSSAGKEDGEKTESEATKTASNLPPVNIDFASLYVYKKDLQFDKQEDFISLSTTLKRRSDSTNMALPTKKFRYISAEIGHVKYNPDRPKVDRAKKKT